MPSLLLPLLLVLGCSAAGAQGGDSPRDSVGIVGGKNAKEAKWPWQVSLRRRGRHICGGSLIERRWVLTTAHCFNPADKPFKSLNASRYQVQVGELKLYSLPPSKLIPVKRIIVHERYNGYPQRGADIALLELSRSAVLSKQVKAIQLPSPRLPVQLLTKCTVTGWGNIKQGVPLPPPYTLQELTVTIFNSEVCRRNYQEITYKIQDDMFCAGDKKEKKGICYGDFGGPLACEGKGSWTLVGMVSWGMPCVLPHFSGVYTNVSIYTEWIRQKMR
ncbi:serine protease 33-like [Ornithorhynchus anatinus]|uniref:serine protease 33-like n=1 Tax=Ornithorhynchus anatinus TaxID=9258 RepID=UPI0010A7B84A|nr:serine protease 33-like [Ornithorhynchus anatinus]